MRREVRIGRVFPDGFCEIHVKRESSCDGKCSNCGGCTGRPEPIVAKARNLAGLSEGDFGVVETRTELVLGLAALFYLLPIALFFLGYFSVYAISGQESIAYIAGGLLFALSCVFSILSGKRRSKTALVVVSAANPPQRERPGSNTP